MAQRERSGALALPRPLAGLALALAAAAVAASGGSASAGTVLGVLDARTGILVPSAPATRTPTDAAPAAAAPVVRIGVIKLVGSFKLGREIPGSLSLPTSGRIAAYDTAANVSVATSGTVVRSAGGGSATLLLPYYWTLGAASDQVTVAFSTQVTSNGITYQFIKQASVALPANGATTSYAYAIGF